MRLRTALPALALLATLPACSVLGKKDAGTPPEKMEVRNSTGETLFYLYARPAGTTTWSEDLLDGDAYTMSDGESGQITLPRSRTCLYTFRGTDLSATKQVVLTDVDVCRTRTLVVTAMR